MSARGYYDNLRPPRTFTAKYRGRCGGCGEALEAGETVRFDHNDELVHADCDLVESDAETTETCGDCFLTIAVNGECGCET